MQVRVYPYFYIEQMRKLYIIIINFYRIQEKKKKKNTS